MAVELKYFERDSLAAMGLDGAEINKIMAFVHESLINFQLFSKFDIRVSSSSSPSYL